MHRPPTYQFRIPAMGLLMICATFLLLVLGALPLAAGLNAADPVAALLGAVTLGLTAWLFVRCVRVRVVVSADGLVVRNLLRTHHLGWRQVAAIRPEEVPVLGGLGRSHVVLSIGVVDPSLTRITPLATRTMKAGSGVRLFPLMAVLDVHARADGFTFQHELPDGTPLPG